MLYYIALMDEKIAEIKDWLGSNSINVFGLPYSGKDTVGIKLAELIGGKFLSSGLILRAYQENDRSLSEDMNKGALVSQDKFKDIVLPYFSREDLAGYPLVLSSIGRWNGEETSVMQAASEGGHPIKAVVLLNVSEVEVRTRWEVSQIIEDRGERSDDRSLAILENRIAEFKEKTMPVIEFYRKLNLLVPVEAVGTKDEVFNAVVDSLLEYLRKSE